MCDSEAPQRMHAYHAMADLHSYAFGANFSAGTRRVIDCPCPRSLLSCSGSWARLIHKSDAWSMSRRNIVIFLVQLLIARLQP